MELNGSGFFELVDFEFQHSSFFFSFFFLMGKLQTPLKKVGVICNYTFKLSIVKLSPQICTNIKIRPSK